MSYPDTPKNKIIEWLDTDITGNQILEQIARAHDCGFDKTLLLFLQDAEVDMIEEHLLGSVEFREWLSICYRFKDIEKHIRGLSEKAAVWK